MDHAPHKANEADATGGGGSALVHLTDSLSELCPVHNQLFQLIITFLKD